MTTAPSERTSGRSTERNATSDRPPTHTHPVGPPTPPAPGEPRTWGKTSLSATSTPPTHSHPASPPTTPAPGRPTTDHSIATPSGARTGSGRPLTRTIRPTSVAPTRHGDARTCTFRPTADASTDNGDGRARAVNR